MTTGRKAVEMTDETAVGEGGEGERPRKKHRPRGHQQAVRRKEWQRLRRTAKLIPLDELWWRDGGICWICGEGCDWVDSTRDHVVPWSKGGTWEWSNLRLAHEWCNNSRQNEELDEGELSRLRSLQTAHLLQDLFDPTWGEETTDMS